MTQVTLFEQARPLDDAALVLPRASHADTALQPVLELALVDTFAAFEALEADWNTLFEAHARPEHVFQSFNWCWHWCRHYLGDGTSGPRLAIVTARRSGRLVLVLPLVAQRAAGLTELVWLGEPVSQYGDALAAPEAASTEALAAAWGFVVARTAADVAHLRRIREDARATPLLRHLRSGVTATEEAPYLTLTADTSFDAWESRRQPRGRKNRKRQLRRLADMGRMEFHSYISGDLAGRLARTAVELKRESLGAKGAISRAMADPRFAAFFADAASGAGGRCPGIVVKAVTVADAPAAIKVLVDNKGARFLHIAVFAPAYEKCGAGAVLLENAVRRTIDQRYHTLDLLPPRHEYKLDFADGATPVHDYALALTAKGWLYAQGYLRVRRRLKAAVEGLPAPIRRVLARIAG